MKFIADVTLQIEAKDADEALTKVNELFGALDGHCGCLGSTSRDITVEYMHEPVPDTEEDKGYYVVS